MHVCCMQAVKDSIDVQGYPTTGATPALAGKCNTLLQGVRSRCAIAESEGALHRQRCGV